MTFCTEMTARGVERSSGKGPRLNQQRPHFALAPAIADESSISNDSIGEITHESSKYMNRSHDHSQQKAQAAYNNTKKLMNNSASFTSQEYKKQSPNNYTCTLQPFVMVNCDQQTQQKLSEMQKILFEHSAQGTLMVKYEDLQAELIQRGNLQYKNQVKQLVEIALDQGLVHKTLRSFLNTQLTFISLKINILSFQCLDWVLESLRKDQMTPLEQAVKNRIKEAFAFKVNNQQWEGIITYIRDSPGFSKSIKNWHNNLEKEDFKVKIHYVPRVKLHQFQMISSDDLLMPIHSQEKMRYLNAFQFQIVDITDKLSAHEQQKQLNYSSSSVATVSSSNNLNTSGVQKPYFAGSNTHAIYSKYEDEWIGKDSSTSSVEHDLYELLKEFLEDHFSKPIPLENSPKSTIDNLWYTSRNNILQNKNPKEMLMQNEDEERIRVIPGGKYGCSSFVKFCASQRLQNETIGSISQMVQLAIDEDILRYHKTLLVRTTDVDMHKAKAEKNFTSQNTQQDFKEAEVVPVFQNESQRQNMIDYKRQCVKETLLEILAEEQGMSLAQLPMNLNKKLPFYLDLNELGFPKLKDFLYSMSDQITLDLRGNNHPYAQLKEPQNYTQNKSLSRSYEAPPNRNPKPVTQRMPQNQTSQGPKNGGYRQLNTNTERHHHDNYNQQYQQAYKQQHTMNNSGEDDSRINDIVGAFVELIQQNPFGLHSQVICRKISMKIGYQFDPSDFGSLNLLNFVQKYITTNDPQQQAFLGTQDIELNMQNPPNFILRSRQHWLNQSQLQQQQETQFVPRNNQYPPQEFDPRQSMQMASQYQSFQPTNQGQMPQQRAMQNGGFYPQQQQPHQQHQHQHPQQPYSLQQQRSQQFQPTYMFQNQQIVNEESIADTNEYNINDDSCSFTFQETAKIPKFNNLIGTEDQPGQNSYSSIFQSNEMSPINKNNHSASQNQSSQYALQQLMGQDQDFTKYTNNAVDKLLHDE